MTLKRYVVAIVAVSVVVGSSAVLAAGAETAASDGERIDVQENETTVAAGNETANVTFDNQTSNGSVVVVNSTVLPEGGFVVIQLAQNVTGNETGIAGENATTMVLGNSTLLESGTHRNVTIRLNQSLTEIEFPTQTLVAVAYRDSNDNGQFDPDTDQPYVVEGEPVSDEAFIELAANETAGANETETA